MNSRNVLLIDGIADYSILSESKFYEQNNHLLLLGSLLKNKVNLNVELYDFRKGESNVFNLLLLIDNFHPSIIFIALHSRNVNNAINLAVKLDFENLIFFTDDLILWKYYSKIVKYKFVVFDNRESFSLNYCRIVNEICPEYGTLKFDYDPCFWNITTLNSKNVIDIVIGTGCLRKCLFCYFNSSPIVFNSLSEVIEEVKYLLNNGVKIINIRNHSFIVNKKYVEKFCYSLIEQFSSYDFGWSCYLMPEYVVDILELLPLLKKSKLEKVNLGLWHVNSSILSSYNVNFDLKEVEHLITQLYHCGITSISIDYLIGSELENNNTLNELIEFSKKMMILAPGTIEFNLKSFDLMNIVVRPKKNFLDKIKFNELKMTFYQQCGSEQKRTYEEIDISQKIRHIKLAEKGCLSLYYLYYISKSAMFSIYKLRILNPMLKYSWEIEDNILDYTPLLFVKYAYKSSYRVLMLNKQTFFLSEYFFCLYKLIKEYKCIGDMIEFMSSEYPSYSRDENRRRIIDFFLRLEKNDVLLFIKCLNKY